MTLSYIQAIVIGLLQGVSELFPVSSLGHSVLIPALLGWHNLVNGQSSGESFYLAFVVGLHVATAGALILYFWRDWVAIARGFFHSLKTRSIETADERIAWLLVVATIPVGLTGFLFEHTFRTLFAKPFAAAVFLTINGLILAGAELLRQRQARTDSRPTPTATTSDPADYKAGDLTPSVAADRRLATLSFGSGIAIGSAQILALFAGISRSGVTMAAGLVRKLNHEDSGTVLVPSRDAGHPGGGGAEDPRLVRPPGQRHPRPDPRREYCRRRGGLSLRPLLAPMVSDPDVVAVLDLLSRGRDVMHRLLRLVSCRRVLIS